VANSNAFKSIGEQYIVYYMTSNISFKIKKLHLAEITIHEA